MSDPLVPPILDAVEQRIPAKIEASVASVLAAITGNAGTLASGLEALASDIEGFEALLNAGWAAKLDAIRAGLTDARMGYLDRIDRSISQAGLKSVQRGIATIGAAANSAAVTVTAVVMAKSFLLISTSYANADMPSLTVYGVLSNSTTVTFARNGVSGTSTISWQLVEFY